MYLNCLYGPTTLTLAFIDEWMSQSRSQGAIYLSLTASTLSQWRKRQSFHSLYLRQLGLYHSHTVFPCFPSSAYLHVNPRLSMLNFLQRWGSQSRVTRATGWFASQMEFPFCPSRTAAYYLIDTHSSKFECMIYFGSTSVILKQACTGNQQ